MADGFSGLYEGISAILGRFFGLSFLGTSVGMLLVAFGVVGMVFAFLIRRFYK